MRSQRRELTTIRFHGPSFEDHGLELSVLPELVEYKRILVETAKELWRVNHPERERIPRGFETSIRIKFYGLCEGSTAVPLFQEIDIEDDQLSFEFKEGNELEQAVEAIEAGLHSAQEDRPLPESFPKNVLPLFENLGKTLGEHDSIQLRSPKSKKPVEFNGEVRQRLLGLVDRTYEDEVTLGGEVRLADLDGSNFVIRLDDGTKIPGKFELEQEATIVEALRNHNTCRLKLQGRGQFSYREAAIKKVIKVDRIDVIPVGPLALEENARPVWESISEIGAQVPEEEWDQVPTDLSKELDRYLYGNSRSNQ